MKNRFDRHMTEAAVILINPKTPFNVGSAIRACSIFGVDTLRWTGKRISEAEAKRKAGSTAHKDRLPREERFKDYHGVSWHQANDKVISDFADKKYVPVAIEIMPYAELLPDFVHPQKAVYIFGSEDSTLGRSTLSVCHRFVRIPTITRTPLNLAAAVNLVLYDRMIKEQYSVHNASDEFVHEWYKMS